MHNYAYNYAKTAYDMCSDDTYISDNYNLINELYLINKSRSIRLNINFKDNNKYYKMHYYLNIYLLIILLLLAVPNFRNK